ADLPRYYASYPFHDLPSDWRIQALLRASLKRLERAGVQRSNRILDYGCGAGALVRFLRKEGFTEVRGFDEFSDEFKDRSVLDGSFDCIVCQDVIEHVPSPNELLSTFTRLTSPGSVIAIGTPDAAAIDLGRAEDYVHTLHQPYH